MPRLQHTVTFRLNHPTGSAAETAFLRDAHTALTSIPGVEDFRIHAQVGSKSDLTFQFSMFFADEGAYTAYDTHPTHVAFVAERWVPEVAEFQEFDYVAMVDMTNLPESNPQGAGRR
ncbi:hypothetical protein M2317_000922 [Microbacterium sp. ZKA21]|uniref:Dabb family protein n=1 Tax=Microbacterium sp. ZKA21 TaxID=3381694 RepID=UPI003D20939B